jgi:hypothetical protein
MLGGFLHICICTCTIYCGLWPADNTSCIFLTWYQGYRFFFSHAQLVRSSIRSHGAGAAYLFPVVVAPPTRPCLLSVPLTGSFSGHPATGRRLHPPQYLRPPLPAVPPAPPCCCWLPISGRPADIPGLDFPIRSNSPGSNFLIRSIDLAPVVLFQSVGCSFSQIGTVR